MRLITNRRWKAHNADLAHAHQHIRKLSGQLAYAFHQLARAETDTDRAEQYAGRLEAEALELLVEVQHAEQALDRARGEAARAVSVPIEVFVLSRWGELHSVHTSLSAARDEAGFPDEAQWEPTPAGQPLAEAKWRISCRLLERGEAAVLGGAA